MNKHHAEPTPDTVIRERDRKSADGNTPADYPLRARCQSCRREIRIEAALGSGWKHTAAPTGTATTVATKEHRDLHDCHLERRHTHDHYSGFYGHAVMRIDRE